MRSILFLPFFLFMSNIFAQSNLKLIYTISHNNLQKVAVDNLLNVYSLTDTEIKKYNRQDTLFTRFSELNYGEIYSADFSNPMRITVFYRDFNKLIILDNTLNYLRNPIDLIEDGYNQIHAVCSSYDGGIWMYSRENFTLNRYTINFQKDRTVPNLNTIIDPELEVVSMLEKDNKLYLLADNGTLYIFDIFGAYIKSLPIGIEREFAVFSNIVYWLKNDELNAYDLSMFVERRISLPIKGVKGFSLHSNRVVLLTTDKLAVYSIEN